MSNGISHTSKKAPKISVILTTYNRAKWIRTAVESILKQDHADFELLVGDNASSDGTETYFSTITDPRVYYFRHEKNIGGIANAKFLLDRCSGEYIALFHDDDEMLPHSLRIRAELLDANPSVGLVHTNIFEKTETSLRQYWGDVRRDFIPNDEIVTGEEFLRRLTLWRLDGHMFGINMPTVMVRRTVFEKVGAFNPAVTHLNDKEMWMRISLFYEIGYISTPTVNYRIHETQHSSELKGYRAEEQEYLAFKQFYAKHGESHAFIGPIWLEFKQALKLRLTENISSFSKGGNLNLVMPLAYLLAKVDFLYALSPRVLGRIIQSMFNTGKRRMLSMLSPATGK